MCNFILQSANEIDSIIQAREDWFLVTAEKDGKANCLTAGWFNMGNVWEKKTVDVFIRPQRETKKYMDAAGEFTLTFFDGQKEAMTYLGSHSGAEDPDKIEHSGLHLCRVNGLPTYEEGRLVIECRTMYVQQIDPACFADDSVCEAAYPEKDYSYRYTAEIVRAYKVAE